MITWVTVWVLTITMHVDGNGVSYAYQLQYASQSTCIKQAEKHKIRYKSTRCDFQQIPVVVK